MPEPKRAAPRREIELAACTKLKTEQEPPNRTNCLVLKLLAAVVKARRLVFGEIRPCVPYTEKELPNRVAARVLRLLPDTAKSRQLKADPRRMKLLTDMVDPRWTNPITDMLLTEPVWNIPCTLAEEPQRAKLRKDKLDARWIIL
jgi:hypothetical protein